MYKLTKRNFFFWFEICRRRNWLIFLFQAGYAQEITAPPHDWNLYLEPPHCNPSPYEETILNSLSIEPHHPTLHDTLLNIRKTNGWGSWIWVPWCREKWIESLWKKCRFSVIIGNPVQPLRGNRMEKKEETGVSRHHGGLIEGPPLEPLKTIDCCDDGRRGF